MLIKYTDMHTGKTFIHEITKINESINLRAMEEMLIPPSIKSWVLPEQQGVGLLCVDLSKCNEKHVLFTQGLFHTRRCTGQS